MAHAAVQPVGRRNGALFDPHVINRRGIRVAGVLLHVNPHRLGRPRHADGRMIDNLMFLQTGRHSEGNVRRAGQSNRRAASRHAILRNGHAGHVASWAGRIVATNLHAHRGAGCGGAADRHVIAGRLYAARCGLAAGHFQILVAEANDCQDGSAAIGFDDRIDARIKPSADQRLYAGQGQLLELGVGEIDHLGDKVAAEHLVEIFVRKLDWNRVMR